VHLLALEQRRPLDDPVILDLLGEPRQQVPPDLRVGQLATPESHRDLDPVSVLEELDRSMDLRGEVADADLRRQSDLLEGHRPLPSLGLLLALRDLVLVLAEVEKSGDRRLGHRGDLDEVQPSLLRHLEGSRRRHHTELIALFIDHPDLWDPDHLVDAQVSCYGWPLRSLAVLLPSRIRGHAAAGIRCRGRIAQGFEAGQRNRVRRALAGSRCGRAVRRRASTAGGRLRNERARP
jgi:hypothetical protein